MFDKINDIIADAGSRLDRTAHNLIDRVTKFAGSIVVMLVFGLLAAVALLTLCAAAVVALVPALGTAGALAVVGTGLLLTSIIVIVATSARFKSDPAPVRAPHADVASNGQVTPPLNNHTTEVKPNPNHSSSTHAASGFDIPPVDPLLVTAAAGAALALFGPARLARTAARATAAASLVRTIMPLIPSVMAGLRSAVTSATNPATPKQPSPSTSTY